MKALLVIDIQKSYITKYETDIVQRINERIIESQKAQYDIVYIKNTKKLRSGMVTDEFADDLILASDNVFCKRRADAFSSEELISYLKSKGVSEIEMLGVDGNSCIKALAQVGLAKPHYIPRILSCLSGADLSEYKDSMRPLIEKDIVATETILSAYTIG